jgi:hypothetical protein
VGGEPRSSFITSTPNGRIPARLATAPAPAYQGTGDEAGGRERPGLNDNPETRGAPERCLFAFGNISGPVMVPSLYNNNYQIVQGKDSVAINVEMVHDARIVPIDGRPHLPSGLRQYTGDSIGRWDGRTFVIDTTNFLRETSFRGSSASLHLVERLTRVDADTLLYEFTVDDPKTWTKPWTAAVPMKRVQTPIYEYACHEGNYALRNILSGARAAER